jgi:hypothetical protein
MGWSIFSVWPTSGSHKVSRYRRITNSFGDSVSMLLISTPVTFRGYYHDSEKTYWNG